MSKQDFPQGKFIATVKVGEKGQIVIPKGARDLFGIQPGDTLVLLADIEQGIALMADDQLMQFAQNILRTQEKPQSPEEVDT